jgi:ABC-type transport system involved in multi-copper enzyme maturation permease subunit
MSNTFRIAWIAIRELLHEKVFYILLSFSLASFVFSLLLGQLTYAEQAKLTLDFMLGCTHFSMALFAVFMGISLFQKELLSGSISMTLSKPISRTTFIVGKCLGQIGMQFLMTLAMGTLTLALTSRYGAQLSSMATLQTTLLIAFEISVLTAITYLFAVNTGAITTAILTLTVFALGHTRDLVSSNLREKDELLVWNLTRTVIPDMEVFNMKQLASYGQSIPWNEFGWAGLYAAVCFAFYLFLAAVCFERKDILT